ncbi:subtilisin-like protease SBT5.4 [Bidens hawaiensis]|uniref:subtilisin-like protease SBT5.4 n=1 Tax=Bidens hawaiensis TaxID=980011 RepID=UPI0040497855
MKLCRVLVAIFITACVLQSSSFAIKKSYIVYLGGLDRELGSSQIKESHLEFLGSILGSKERVDEAMIYSYNEQFNGFAALLDEEDAANIAEHPDVVTVIQNVGRKLHTTRSWDFLNLEKNGFIGSSSLWTKARFGENVIIANLDTGVWPESKSFNGDGYGPIPSRWKGGCENGTLVPCNNKLIGSKYYNKGYQAKYGKMDPLMNNARDQEGHGSHTLSTAGGNFVRGVSINGIGNGTAKGGSPRARVAAYKVCWPPKGVLGGDCDDADIVKGFESAIHDGVDVLSVSLGGIPAEYMDDGLAIASFHAVKKGITVVFSAGNDGPRPGSVTNVSPWVITVGASTIDREFQSFVHLASGLSLKGLSMSKPLPHSGFYPLTNAANAKAENATMIDVMVCAPGTLDPKKVQGNILVCLRGGNIDRVDKGIEAARAGAAGMILRNDEVDGNEIIADPHVLPATHITYADGLRLYAYLNSTNEPSGYITPPKDAVNIKPAPFMAAFSSRGPNSITPEILKPDITAPGVNIIAAFSEDPEPVLPYNIDSGTSMSCPHVAGVVGLLKSIHPDWSPAAIKSAIMTTANTNDNRGSPMLDETKNDASPFSRGAGHIDPNRAMNPGLVYDLTSNDYLDFLCARGSYDKDIIRKFSDQPYQCPEKYSILDFNYPSITVHKLNGTVNVTRRLKNVGPPGVYTVNIKSPVGISVDVKPNTLAFRKKGEEQKFELTMKADGTSVIRDYVFGELIWSNGKQYHVKSPIVVSVA